jgi:EpsI family protein
MMPRAIVLFLVLVSGSLLLAAADRPEETVARTPFNQFPMEIGEWKGERLPPIDDKVLAVLGADDYLNRAYFAPDRSSVVGLYIGYYGTQRQGDTMHSPLNCLPGAGWEPLVSSRIPIQIGRDADIVVNRYIVQKGLDRQLVLYWYQSHGRAVASEYWSKLYLIGDAVRLNRTDGALVRVIAPIAVSSEDEGAAAERQATGFIHAFYPQLDSYLPR